MGDKKATWYQCNADRLKYFSIVGHSHRFARSNSDLFEMKLRLVKIEDSLFTIFRTYKMQLLKLK